MRKIVVLDFETGSLDVATLEPVQVAALVIDPRTLELGETFCSLMRPLDMNNLQQAALDKNKKTRAELAKAPEQAVVWRAFCDFVYKQNPKGKSPFSSPIPAGKNIRNFDIPIADRLCRTYGMVDKGGKPNLFDRRMQLDLEDEVWRWLDEAGLPNQKMDTLREYFGLSTKNAHDAATDVKQTADLLVSFLKLYRKLAPRVKFRNSLVGK